MLNLYSIKFKNFKSSYHKPWIYYFGKVLLDSAIVYSNYQSIVQCADSKIKLFIRVIQWDVWIYQDSQNDEEITQNVKFSPGNIFLY